MSLRRGGPMKRRRMRAPKLTAKRQEKRERRAVWAVAVKARGQFCEVGIMEWVSRLTPVMRHLRPPPEIADCVSRATDAHHMLPKSQGGPDELWNGIAMCNRCHMWVHAHRIEAQALGLLAHVGDCSNIEPVGASDRERA